jgi:serralysin
MERLRRHRLRICLLAAGICGTLLPHPVRAFIITPSDPDPWQTTASGTRPGNGAAATITWSIVPDGTSLTKASGFGTSSSNLIAFMNSTFGGNSAQTNLTLQPWFHLFTDALGRWAQLGGVNYVYEPHDDGVLLPSSNGTLGVRGDIRIGGYNVDGASGTLAFTYLPTSGSDMVIDTGDGSFFSNSTNNHINFRNTVMHELGHSFGLEHVSSTTSNLLMEPIIDTSFDGPQLDEVRGVQYFFGDVNEKSNGGLGNGTFARATSLGVISPGGTKTIGAAANVPTQAISATATDFVSISNVDDTDFYSFSVLGPTLLAATLTPRGGVFTQGSADDGQNPTSFNANARNNLALALLSTNGTTILSTADANPAGIAESISNLLLPSAGTYFARITGADDTVQLYELSLSAISTLPGDYNKNGIVDAADYVVWRNSQGQSVAAGSGADGNSDGQITAADFTVWRLHYGQTAGSGAGAIAGVAVPEPASALIIIVGMLVMYSRLRVRNS